MKAKYYLLSALCAAGIGLTGTGCSDTWDEHYTPGESTVNNTDVMIVDEPITSYLSQEPSLSGMYQLLEETGIVDQMEQRQQLYTVLAVEGGSRADGEVDGDELYKAQSHVSTFLSPRPTSRTDNAS